MPIERRFYTRYPITCECILAFESGLVFEAEIVDISAEGARIRVDREIFLKYDDKLYINIKCKYKIKLKAKVCWINKIGKNIEFGVKFLEVSMQDRESLSKLIFELASDNISDIYFR